MPKEVDAEAPLCDVIINLLSAGEPLEWSIERQSKWDDGLRAFGNPVAHSSLEAWTAGGNSRIEEERNGFDARVPGGRSHSGWPLIGSVGSGYRCDRTPSCDRSWKDFKPTL